MKMVKYNPSVYHQSLNSIVDELFNRPFGSFIGSDGVNQMPATNIKETPESFLLDFAAPGLEKSDFNIKVEQGYLIVESNKELEKTEETDQFLRREFNYSVFKRSFKLSNKVDAQGITASYHNGVLTVTIPKKEEAKVTHKVEIA